MILGEEYGILPAMKHGILKLSCPDQIGILAKISGFFAERDHNLLEVHQYTDKETGQFFCRIEFEDTTGEPSVPISSAFSSLGENLGATWKIRDRTRRCRVALMVSRDGHCLADLIWRWKDQSLLFDLVGVVSNHSDLQEEVLREDVPFAHLPVDASARSKSYAKIEEQLGGWEAETVVMARYMQIVPPDMCKRWESRLINIHHSFLPAFAGGNAYHQAYQRGVKLIGATCHYATAELDQGPIIAQEVMRTSHCHSSQELRRLGQDCERLALAKGLKFHLEERVFCVMGRTVILGD